MPDTLIYILIFAAIMFIMHRGHGMGSCGSSHSHGHSEHSHKSNNNKDDKNQKSGIYHNHKE